MNRREGKTMTEEEAISLGNVVLSEVDKKLSISRIRIVAVATGIDASRIPADSERKGGASNAPDQDTIAKLNNVLSKSSTGLQLK
jgi:hypothetical protein